MHPLLDEFNFDPSAGDVIREPLGHGYGHWVGGHKVTFDEESGDFWMFYRERSPLEMGRGGRGVVARSADGVHFDDVWQVTKDELDASSIEVGHMTRTPDGEWRLYISYERKGTTTWRIDVIRADHPDKLDAQHRRTVLNPDDYGLPWVKDPFLVLRDEEFWLYAAVPARRGSAGLGNLLEAQPIDATALAISTDGLIFHQLEYVFDAPGDRSWHGRRARLNSVFRWRGQWAATFDGGRTSFDNYEEMSGLAVSPDGRNFTRLDEGAPWLASPYGCVRYAFVLPTPVGTFAYYEYTRRDLSHDLRVVRLS